MTCLLTYYWLHMYTLAMFGCVLVFFLSALGSPTVYCGLNLTKFTMPKQINAHFLAEFSAANFVLTLVSLYSLMEYYIYKLFT